MDRDLVLAVQRAVGVDADGDFGNVTLAAVAAKLGIVQKKNPVIAAAESQLALNIRETSNNHGPEIEKFWSACDYSEGYNDRAPWCAAFVCWVIRAAGIFSEQKRPKTAAAFGFEEWATDHGLKVTKAPQSVRAGQIVVFSFSHVAIAVSDSDRNGNFQTIEGNTNPQGARDGNGVFRKVRYLSVVRSVVTI